MCIRLACQVCWAFGSGTRIDAARPRIPRQRRSTDRRAATGLAARIACTDGELESGGSNGMRKTRRRADPARSSSSHAIRPASAVGVGARPAARRAAPGGATYSTRPSRVTVRGVRPYRAAGANASPGCS